MIVGRDRLNVMRMIVTMRVASDGSRMVMKDTFSSVTLVEGNAHEERIVEMESRGMEALLRAAASSLSYFLVIANYEKAFLYVDLKLQMNRPNR